MPDLKKYTLASFLMVASGCSHNPYKEQLRTATTNDPDLPEAVEFCTDKLTFDLQFGNSVKQLPVASWVDKDCVERTKEAIPQMRELKKMLRERGIDI